MKKVLTLILSFSVFLTGCASIVNGTSQKLTVQAIPSEATIKLLTSNGALIRQQNGSMYYDLKKSDGYFRSASYNLEVSMEGYQTQVIPLKSSISGGWYFAGNIVFGGLIGWLIVDPLTGGMWVIEAENGQKTESLQVTLLQDTPDLVLKNAKKID